MLPEALGENPFPGLPASVGCLHVLVHGSLPPPSQQCHVLTLALILLLPTSLIRTVVMTLNPPG